jgi:uncharacterized membrane protein YozB (DUF420 family)
MGELLAAHPIVHVNASLNALATLLIVAGWLLIRRGRETAHKRAMLAAFAVSTAFLACYVWYHWQVGSVRFTQGGVVRGIYLSILLSHIILAAIVPFLTIWQIYLGYRAVGCCSGAADSAGARALAAEYRRRHRRTGRWATPIWLYVSVTGVIVYVMLYHLYPPPPNSLEWDEPTESLRAASRFE